MTYEERTNIESYLENLNNLVELKKALKRSLDLVEGDIEFSMFQIEEQTDDDSFAFKPLNPLREYQEIMQGGIEELLPCWKVAIN